MRLFASAAFSALALMLGACSPASAPAGDEPAASERGLMIGSLVILDGVVFIPAEGRDVTAGFGTFAANDRAVTIVEAEAPFAQAVELHTHAMDEEGRMAMRKVENFTVPANGVHELRRGGDHLMFFGIDRSQLVEGELVPVMVRAEFEDGTNEVVLLNLKVSQL
ncbi:copper chaperone PCu(A)C [Hyphomonas sp.]|uniref:copper chaperone PCu(A)C n=1 Tax=Hyphomonas sp. TaxID=87 RepID=UPI00391B52A4